MQSLYRAEALNCEFCKGKDVHHHIHCLMCLQEGKQSIVNSRHIHSSPKRSRKSTYCHHSEGTPLISDNHKHCLYCNGTPINSDNHKHCLYCNGTPVSDGNHKHCISCNFKSEISYRYCPDCGLEF